MGRAKIDGYEMTEDAGPQNLAGERTETPAPAAEFPTEPFPCPACGQLLAASCRVCVACRHVIDPAEILVPQQAAPEPVAAPEKPVKRPSVRYPWGIFFAVLGVSFLLTEAFIQLWGIEKAQLAMGGIQALAGIWVFLDALRRRIPRPLRWGVGSMLLPVIIFPWYLARRKLPDATCRFVEAETGPVTRFLLFALFIFLLLSLTSYLIHWPAPK